MAVQLFGNINTLQGGTGVQAGANPMQTGNPQQGYNPVAPVAPVAPKPAVAPRTTAPRVVAPQSAPQVQPVQISQAFAPYVQTRPSPSNPGVLEYYNPQNGKGFSNPNDVFSYVRTMTGHSITDLKQLETGTNNGSLPSYGGSNLNTPVQPTDPSQNLATLAGGAGIGYEDYLKLIQNQNGLSLAEKEKIKAGLGIPDLESQIFKPAPSTESLYTTAFKSAGLGDLKSKIESKLEEVNRIQSAYTEKSGEINENPWLSDASRTGRLRINEDKRLQEIGNLNQQLSSMKELYNAGVNEVNNLVTRQSTDFNNNQQLNSFKLQYLQGKAEEQITSKQSEKVNAAYPYLPDYLKAKAAAQKPDTIGSNETGFYRWDPATSTFQQVIAPQITPSYQANPLTGELYDSKTGLGLGAGGNSGDIIGNLAQQVMANPALLSGLPSAQQTAVIARLAQSGQPVPAQMTPEQKNKIASVSTLQQTIVAIESLGAKLDWKGIGGAFKGSIAQFVAKNFGKGSQEEQMLRSYIGNLQATIAKERGGTSFTANEQALLEQYSPTINDSPLVIQSKLQALKQYFASSVPSTGGAGGNASDPLGIRFNSAGNASASTPYLRTLGPVTGLNGSSAWAPGLDVDLKRGDPVRSPVSGTVIAAAPNGGFGNQIKIKTADGREVWLSHLDSGSVRIGQKVNAGQIVAIGGNTGHTIPGPGGDGSHLDITIKDSNGKLLTAPQVKSFLDKIYV